MKRCFAVLLSVLLLVTYVLPVSADGYNDDQFDWGEYACTHSVVKSVDAVASTCITPGHDAYTRCVECAMLLSGSDAELPLGDHTYDNTCDVDCNLCGENREVSHNVVAVEAVAPTCFENGNIEYWYCADCGQAWLDEACTLNTNLKAVVLPSAVAHDIVYMPAVETGCHFSGNSEYWMCSLCSNVWADVDLTQETTIEGVTLPAVGSEKLQHVAAKEETCYEPGNIEHWYCPDCDQYWKDAELTKPTTAKKVLVPIVHKLAHVAAKDATCFEEGNIEYWYCKDCGQAWLDALCHLNTNLKAVILPMEEHNWKDADCITAKTCSVCGATEGEALGHIAGPAADCENEQICTVCGEVLNIALGHTWVDASCYEPKHCSTCGKIEGDVAHGDIIHVEAVAPTCTAMGNIEYWYCADCGQAWLDSLCHLNTNLQAVKLPAIGEHFYDDDRDTDCNVCGAVREPLRTPGDLNGDGNINNRDLALMQQYLNGWDVTADESAADVTGDGNINNRDLALLQQYLNGWDVTLK